VAHLVFVRDDGAKLEACLARGFLPAEPFAHQVGGAGFEVEAKFFVHVFFQPMTPEGCTEPRLQT
jgi:hypothetical protein